MNNLSKLKKDILIEKLIEKQTVEQLRDILFAENRISQEKANLLFELKDAFLGKNNHSSWQFPNWLVISSIDDLKSSLGKVILMILIVSFFGHSLNIHYENISDLLYLGIGILLIAAALFLTHAHVKHKE
jgi:hypothetical protein